MEKIKRFFKNEFVKLIIIGLIINISAFFMGTIYAHCASNDGSNIPYNINNIYSYGNYTDVNEFYHSIDMESVKDVIIQNYGEYNFIGWINDFSYNSNNSEFRAYFNLICDVTCEESYTLNYSFSSNYIRLRGYSATLAIAFNTDGTFKRVVTANSVNPSKTYFNVLGQPNVFKYTYFDNAYVYCPNYPCLSYNLGDDGITDTNGYSVIIDKVVQINPDPTAPDWDDNLPNKPTAPNIINPPTIPTINDISDLGNWLLSLFQWLINVIVAWSSYIGDLIEWTLTKLGNTIKQGFENIYNNFKNFLKPIFDTITDSLENVKNTLQNIKDSIEKFFDPFDFNQAQTQLNNSRAITSIRGIVTNIKTFANVFTNTSEPDNLTFTLDFTNNSFFNFGVCFLDFNVIKPFRSAIRLIIGCLLVFGLIVTISTSINAYIGGNSSKNEG